MGVLAPSLHIESTDSMIAKQGTMACNSKNILLRMTVPKTIAETMWCRVTSLLLAIVDFFCEITLRELLTLEI